MCSAHFARSILAGVAALVMAAMLSCDPAGAAADLKVMNTGLGAGTITSATAGIDCGGDCEETYASEVSVTLTATALAGSVFAGWDGDCVRSPGNLCTVTMSADRSVRAIFALDPGVPPLSDCELEAECTARSIRDYLDKNPSVNSAARFVAALPSAFKQNWILMARSESLQTGTAEFPRILLPSADARFVFTLGLAVHSSYPGSHPDAIEYMQWDGTQKNFRFHEIILNAIPQSPDGSSPARSRGVSEDDAKCSKCHSTRNVLNRTTFPGTTGDPAGTITAKAKPNWDTYDSWAGMMPLNRDRIYQGSVEAAAFRKIFNPWTWRKNEPVRAIIGQLELQPLDTATQKLPEKDVISRTVGGKYDGHIRMAFDPPTPVLVEPPLRGGTEATIDTAYSFDGREGTGIATSVIRGGSSVTLRHTSNLNEGNDEGRGVRMFDALSALNSKRIASELMEHRFATGDFSIDVRAIALAVTKSCIAVDATGNTVASTDGAAPLAVNLNFFTSRNGMRINELVVDTRDRTRKIPRRKVDLQKWNLHRVGDPYLLENDAANGLVQQYGAATTEGTEVALSRLRQEVFRRPQEGFSLDQSEMKGIYVDRESYDQNTLQLALYRYFLEPLGVSVDKWSTGVRGRSGAYGFADVFGGYLNEFREALEESLQPGKTPISGLGAPFDCSALIAAVNSTLSTLPALNAIPPYADVQRIFNKSCIDCHGGLGYPPYKDHDSGLDLSEDENPPSGSGRLTRSHERALEVTTADPATSRLYRRITHLNDKCPYGMMPCGGPPLSRADIETIRRWISGDNPRVAGNSHVRTVGGVHYDFQGAGEFVFLRGENLEIQVRLTPVETPFPLAASTHTGLASCASVSSAVAVKIGGHRVTYQPNSGGEPDRDGLQLRIDGALAKMSGRQIVLDAGGRIVRTVAPGGIQIEAPGGTVVAITPGWWRDGQVWQVNVDVRHARATTGMMGAIAQGSWLPALPNGTSMGPRPADLGERRRDLYGKFADAWRVSGAESLFDYAAGTSTNTFTVEGWPGESGSVCTTRRPSAQATKQLALEVAARHCNAIVDADRKANCVQDVRATGEPVFATTYRLAEQIQRAAFATVPDIMLPEDNEKGVGTAVTFRWNLAARAGGGPVTYLHCVWDAKRKFTFKDCKEVPGRGGTGPVSVTIPGLEPGKAYFWKVVAEDGRGGSVESETRRFTTK